MSEEVQIWKPGVTYRKGDIVMFLGVIRICNKEESLNVMPIRNYIISREYNNIGFINYLIDKYSEASYDVTYDKEINNSFNWL